jgi:hypothetical protein
VQIRGIPPRWSEWVVFQQVASSLGKLTDVDWYSLFSNQFAMVRLKIKCKNPSRIPIERVLEIQDELFLLSYKVEGYKQQQNSEGKDGGDEDGDDPDTDEDEDLLKDDLEDLKKKNQPSSSGNDGSKEKNPTPQMQKRGGQGGQQDVQSQTMKTIPNIVAIVTGMDDNKDPQEEPNRNFCINLLRDTELDDRENEDEKQEHEQGDLADQEFETSKTHMHEIGEDLEAEQEQLHLPEEWVYAMSKDEEKTNPGHQGTQTQADEKKETHENVMEQERDLTPQMKKHKGKPEEANHKQKQWGPVQAERRSARLLADGKTVIERAQKLKRKVNLEEPQGTKKPFTIPLCRYSYFCCPSSGY